MKMEALRLVFVFCVTFGFVCASSPAQSSRPSYSDDLFRLISDYVRSASGRSGASTDDSSQVPIPILILPVPVQNSQSTAHDCPDCDKKGRSQFIIQARKPSLAEEINNGFNVNNNVGKGFTHSGTNNQQLNNRFSEQSGFQYKASAESGERAKAYPWNNEFHDQRNNIQFQTNRASVERTNTQNSFNDGFDDERTNFNHQANSAFAGYSRNHEEFNQRKVVQPSLAVVSQNNIYRENFNTAPIVPVDNHIREDYPKFPKAENSRVLLQQFHDQYSHLRGQDLPPALIDKSALDIQVPSSDHLLALFHNQSANYQHQDLPPAVIDRAALDIEGQVDHEEEQSHRGRVSSGFRVQGPPIPQWNFPLNLKAQLHVPRADYSEPYEMWYDSNTKAARVDFHEGGSRTYRMVLPNGQIHRVAMRIDRLGEINIPECRIAAPESHQEDNFIVPGLPDMSEFQFRGYEEAGEARAEKWVRLVVGEPGEMGAANGEQLRYNHVMLVARNNGKPVPVSYTVNVDSTMLGADCDTYTHKYLEVQELDHNTNPDVFNFDPHTQCTRTEPAEPTNPQHLAHLEPLREFTLPHRDLRYDVEFHDFKTKFNREYIDDGEEAMRKNLVVQSTRFVNSGNRQSATFELEVNFLGDRLDAETRQLFGVDVQQFLRGSGHQAEGPIEDFPHPEPMLKMLSKKLPKKFDWRPRGGVSDVKFQGTGCQSCWAFAVAGAVEGALFVKRKVLVPLSEQCLVDCGFPFGTNGCKGTWPRNAYDYVIARGLPATAEYGQYKEKEDTCRDRQVSPVTHISAYVNVTQRSVSALQVAIRRHAPSVVIIDASAKSFVFYKGGVLYDDRCGKTLPSLNHAVLAVGWGEHKKATHFILKNSWSANWGEGGYIRVQGPANTCGVLEQPSYPRLEDKDVDRIPGGQS